MNNRNKIPELTEVTFSFCFQINKFGDYWSANEHGDFSLGGRMHHKEDEFAVSGPGAQWVEGDGKKNHCGSMIQSEKAQEFREAVIPTRPSPPQVFNAQVAWTYVPQIPKIS